MPEVSAAGTGGPPDPAVPPARANRAVTPAVAGALIILALSFALSVAFVLANGGLDLPAAAPVPSADPEPRPTPTPRPHPISNRYDLLTACPGVGDCRVYVVRRGNKLFSIASYFGVPLKVVQARNPWTRTTRLLAGQKLLLPIPSR